MTLQEFLGDVLADGLELAVLSGPKTGGPDKSRIRPVLLSGKVCYQSEYQENKKAFHTNYTEEEIKEYLTERIQGCYRQLQCRCRHLDGTVLSSKKGKVTIRTKRHEASEAPQMIAHNRVRNYILSEGTPVPFLIDLGVMTPEGKVVRPRYDKFRQINRFLEFIRDILPHLPENRQIRILDFGCGKSYLTFAVYYYLHELLGRDVRITGLDLKEDVIEKCNALAEKYGYENLSFSVGDVAGYRGEEEIDMMITLHACDTATDYALSTAVKLNAGVILSVPCCQHELNGQIKSELLEPVLQYGILKERISALITDGIRAELLAENGYQVQILEFIDMEHTPKNLLIRAVRTGSRRADGEGSLGRLMDSLHLDPALSRLLTAAAESARKN